MWVFLSRVESKDVLSTPLFLNHLNVKNLQLAEEAAQNLTDVEFASRGALEKLARFTQRAFPLATLLLVK